MANGEDRVPEISTSTTEKASLAAILTGLEHGEPSAVDNLLASQEEEIHVIVDSAVRRSRQTGSLFLADVLEQLKALKATRDASTAPMSGVQPQTAPSLEALAGIGGGSSEDEVTIQEAQQHFDEITKFIEEAKADVNDPVLDEYLGAVKKDRDTQMEKFKNDLRPDSEKRRTLNWESKGGLSRLEQIKSDLLEIKRKYKLSFMSAPYITENLQVEIHGFGLYQAKEGYKKEVTEESFRRFEEQLLQRLGVMSSTDTLADLRTKLSNDATYKQHILQRGGEVGFNNDYIMLPTNQQGVFARVDFKYGDMVRLYADKDLAAAYLAAEVKAGE